MAEWSHKITDAQRVALRLVAQGYESKEIGRRVGITYHAVDKRIERAVKQMDAPDRKEAARMLTIEENQTYERTAYEPSDVEIPAPQGIVEMPDGAGSADYPWPWIFPRRGRRLARSERLFWAVIGLPVIIMLTWGVFLTGIGALDQLKF